MDQATGLAVPLEHRLYQRHPLKECLDLANLSLLNGRKLSLKAFFEKPLWLVVDVAEAFL